MSNYQLLFHPKVGKQILLLGDVDQKKVRKVLRFVADFGLDYPGLKIKKLQGVNNSYRIKVSIIRVIIEVDQSKKMVYVKKIGYRKDVYRDL